MVFFFQDSGVTDTNEDNTCIERKDVDTTNVAIAFLGFSYICSLEFSYVKAIILDYTSVWL